MSKARAIDLVWLRAGEARFWAKVRKGQGCWEWLGCFGHKGYGRFNVKGKSCLAHRVAWQLANDAMVPDGMFVCHTCDNPSCVNPGHLWIGDGKDNMADAARKGRATGQKGRKLRTLELAHVIRQEYGDGAGKRVLKRKYRTSQETLYEILGEMPRHDIHRPKLSAEQVRAARERHQAGGGGGE